MIFLKACWRWHARKTATGKSLKRIYHSPVPDRGYRHAALVGVLHHTHAPPEAMSEALALLPPGGCVVFTLNDETLRFPEYTDYIDGLVNAGEVEIASMEYGSHLPARNVGARVYVLRKR